MPEISELQNLPTGLLRLLDNEVINARLEEHLNGPFKGAEKNSMEVAEMLMQEQGMPEHTSDLVKLGLLLSDLGKTGCLKAEEGSGVNELIEGIFDIKDHGFDPQKVSLREFVTRFSPQLTAALSGRTDVPVEKAFQDMINVYGFNEGTPLRDLYNHHVLDSMEFLDQAWQQMAAPEYEQDYQFVRKVIALHHAYRVIPEGYTKEDIDLPVLDAMAADIYDATFTRPPLEGFAGNDHESTIRMLQKNFSLLPEHAEQAGQVISTLNRLQPVIANEIYKKGITLPQGTTLKDIAGFGPDNKQSEG